MDNKYIDPETLLSAVSTLVKKRSATAVKEEVSRYGMGSKQVGLTMTAPDIAVDMQPVADAILKMAEIISSRPDPKPVDLKPLSAAVDRIKEAFAAMPQPKEPDMRPVAEAIDRMAETVKSRKDPAPIDMAPFARAVESLAKEIGKQLAEQNKKLERQSAQIEALIKAIGERPVEVKLPDSPKKAKSSWVIDHNDGSAPTRITQE